MKEDIIVYDIEILRAIPDGKCAPGIDYCKGWDDKKSMGISVICAYTYADDKYHVFCKDNFTDFQLLTLSCPVIVGFNSESFDDVVCGYNGLEVKTTFDILREFYKAIGLCPYPDRYTSDYAGFGLDPLCRANHIGGKNLNGAEAPVYWQRGMVGYVIDYCLNDVYMTKALFDLIVGRGKLWNFKNARFVSISFPPEIP